MINNRGKSHQRQVWETVGATVFFVSAIFLWHYLTR